MWQNFDFVKRFEFNDFLCGNWGSSDGFSGPQTSSKSSEWGTSDGSSKWGTTDSGVTGKSVSSGKSVTTDGGNWGSSYSWGSKGLDVLCYLGVYNGLVDGDGLFVDDWGLNNLLDWVHLVWGWDMDSTWNSNFIRLGDMLGVDNGSFDWDWDGYWYIIRYLVNLKFWFDTVKTRGDFGVGTDSTLDIVGGYGISWCWSGVECWGWDGCWGSWDGEGWGGKGTNGSGVGSWGSNLSVCSSGVGDFSSLGVCVSYLYGLRSNLNLTVSNNSGDGTVLCDSWSSMYLFMYSDWSGDNGVSYDGSCRCKASCLTSPQWSGWSSSAQCQTGRQNQKFGHITIC